MTFDPAYEMTGRLFRMLTADAPLQALLFQYRPRVDEWDDRIYAADGETPPEGSAAREVLPRIIIDVTAVPVDVEQADGDRLARLIVRLNAIVEADQRQYGEEISARVREVVITTPLSDGVISAAALVPTAVPRPIRETGFRNAWRFAREYASGIAQVVA